MSDTEKEAFRQIGMTLVNEYRQQRGLTPIRWLAIDTPEASAFIRSIQLHEKTKKELQGVKQELADYKQKVSDAVQSWVDGGIDRSAYLWFRKNLEQFIIPAPKPDPLVQAMEEVDIGAYAEIKVEYADSLRVDLVDRIRAALDALGFEIREKNDD